MGILKADLHLHSGADPRDKLTYTNEELIDYLAAHGYEVMALTLHDGYGYSPALASYAQAKGILLLPGIERTIEGKDVLIYNLTKDEAIQVRTFQDLRALKQKNSAVFVVAPHPYYFIDKCLGQKLIQHIDLFDAVEHCHFYLSWLNPNKKVIQVARRYNKPLLGTSDAHAFMQIGHTYTKIRAEKTPEAIAQAIRKQEIELVSRPLSLFLFLRILFHLFTRAFTQKKFATEKFI
ncbi:PHP domain-containing protein [Candidatus Woesearchaeota archaeon]|nr:PHP domain-containing protein [Candidatus Woesearchaeota archaeon]